MLEVSVIKPHNQLEADKHEIRPQRQRLFASTNSAISALWLRVVSNTYYEYLLGVVKRVFQTLSVVLVFVQSINYSVFHFWKWRDASECRPAEKKEIKVDREESLTVEPEHTENKRFRFRLTDEQAMRRRHKKKPWPATKNCFLHATILRLSYFPRICSDQKNCFR